jgi:hypothetical protein
VGAEVAAVESLPSRPVSAEALAECADEIIGRLAEADKPVLLVDVEVRRYGVEAKVAQLARRLRLPVVTTFMGRGLLSEHGDVVLGSYFGAAGDRPSPGWSKDLTVCCCSASSCRIPTLPFQPARSTCVAPFWLSTATCTSGTICIRIFRWMR